MCIRFPNNLSPFRGTSTHYLRGAHVWAICNDGRGRLWFGTDGGVSVFDGQEFVAYTTDDGLLDNRITDLLEDKEGRLWFAIPHSGVSCLDTSTFQLMTPTPVSEVLIQDRTGGFWFGDDNLLCWLSGGQQHKKIFNARIYSLLKDSDDMLWLGTGGDGLYRYDSSQAVWDSPPQRFTTEDGLSGALLQGRDGTIWLGTGWPGGLCRFDGERFQPISTPHRVVFRLYEDSGGRIWFGGWAGGGLSCYDGGHLITYTMADGLADDRVLSIVEDNAGNLWVGTQAGLCCFDGKQFITYATGEGLSSLQHQCSAKDINGHLWFGTQGGGVYRYNGKHFQQLTTKDGLLNNGVTGLLPQPDGSMIIGTYGGIVHYRPTATVEPGIEIRAITADRVYSNPSALQLNTTGADLLTISYHGLSLATQKMRYSYILDGYDNDWRDTWENSVSYNNLPVGEYTFKVIAINRDLVESEAPATLKLKITPDPRDQQIAQLESDLEKRNRELEAELQDAHDVQMALMPEAAPSICGLEIAGKCLSATEVSGDFFDYLPGESSDEIAVVVGDVTEHGMKGAMNAVMVDGVLRMAAEKTELLSPTELMRDINSVLVTRMEEDMNVTMVIGLINTTRKMLTLASAGHHAYPLLRRNRTIEPLVSKGMPLGMLASISYRDVEFQLQSDDVLVFMTDGIIEAEDRQGNLYGTSGRLEQTVSRFTRDLPATEMVEAIINDAIAYSEGKAHEKDDMTVVVVKVQ